MNNIIGCYVVGVFTKIYYCYLISRNIERNFAHRKIFNYYYQKYSKWKT